MHTLQVIYIIWYREILRYWRDRSRIVGSLAMPFFFLFIFGSGLSPAIGGMTGGLPVGQGEDVNFIKFMYPGVIGMTVLFTSIFSGISIVWDREFGFLKEMLVAPISRTTVALGKTLGGSTVAMIQGTLMLIFAPLVGVELSLGLVLRLWPLMFITAFALTSMGVLIAARMKSMQGFQMIMNFLTMPMFFLSGAFFPLRGLPGWMGFLVRINPFTYAVDSLRQVVFQAAELPQFVLDMLPQLGMGVTIFDHNVTIFDDILIILLFGAVMISAAVWSFRLQD
ncbi:MAG: ABC transporter permease [Anaerolineae bacterium]